MYAKTNIISDNSILYRNSIGGYPILPKGYSWPRCPESNKKMVLFLQSDLEFQGSKNYHLIIFMSPEVNEIPSFDYLENGKPLPELFWEKRVQHFKVILFTGEEELSKEQDQYLVYQELIWTDSQDSSSIKLGGVPNWIQDPENHDGPNHEKLSLLVEIPENFTFPKQESAPEQPDSFSAEDYCLFLGNHVYIFGSIEFKNPEATWVTVQN